MNLEVKSVPISSKLALTLVDELERELRQDYPPHYIHELDVQSFEASQGIFLVCIDANEPIGCLGLRPLNRETGELKRMYVRANFRGRGVAKMMLNEMEHQAYLRGFKRIVLETGNQQHSAIDLYQANGYEPIPPYNHASDGPASVCFCKTLEV
ncbi:MAG: GNAT family N-acetyltransferase [Rubripirellula sp.]|jgi:GNAT superfamily N-acetyltransferase